MVCYLDLTKSNRATCPACGGKIPGPGKLAIRVMDAGSNAGGLWSANVRWLHLRPCTVEGPTEGAVPTLNTEPEEATMSHVPRLICNCDPVGIEMTCSEIGVRVRVDRVDGEPYYLIAMDRWVCVRCERSVLLTGPNQQPIREHFHPEFDPKDCDAVADLRS